MPKNRLTQRRVDALKPRKKTLDVRDSVIRGFGVRVLPSGRKRYFLHSQVDGRRVWQSTGDAHAVTLERAQEQATSFLTSRSRSDEALPDHGQAILFEDVADEVFRRYKRHWKPSTLKVSRHYYRKQVLPWFKGRAIGGITRRDVQRWLASLHATPVSADRSVPVLSVILRPAEVYGYRPAGSNPCTGIKRDRRRNRERFLNDDEIRRLSRVLDKRHEKRPLLAATVRLLLLSTAATKRSDNYAELRITHQSGHEIIRGKSTPQPRCNPGSNRLDSQPDRDGSGLLACTASEGRWSDCPALTGPVVRVREV